MTANEQPTRPMPRGRLLLATAAAVIAAALVVFGGILPAEYNVDPLGLGKLTGVSRLWAPPEKKVDTKDAAAGPAAKEYDIPFREDFVEIPLGDFMTGAENSELEWKVRMKKGATVTYSWEAVGKTNPEDIYFDHHGHDIPAPGKSMTVGEYRKGMGVKQQGALVAPFDGIHGWFFQNNAEGPAVIRVKVAGFYELIPAGQPGNEASIVANVPAAQARPGAPAAIHVKP